MSHQLFCALCFASDEDGSLGGIISDYCCSNCGASGSSIKLPKWAVNSIREQASFVGKRFYPNKEDYDNEKELKSLRSTIKTFPGRTAVYSDMNKCYTVWQKTGKDSKTGIFVNASSSEEALELSRLSLPYIPEDMLNA